jgi:hypothetical protein
MIALLRMKMILNDQRYTDMHGRLSLLTSIQIRKILDTNPEEICYDTYNYDTDTQCFCPMAIALDIPRRLAAAKIDPTQNIVEDMLKVYGGEAWGTVKGIPGTFYTDNRPGDLRLICLQILHERSEL